MLKNKKCLICKTIFSYYPGTRPNAKYCGIKCQGLGAKLNGIKPPVYYGDKHPSWRGGKGITTQGYIRLNVGTNKRNLEHRVVMEKFLGRKLKSNEIVHHKNEDRTDNRIENLELMGWGTHTIHHHLGKKQNRK